MGGALGGIRVLDLSRFIAGPLCAQMLGDAGAEVIRVERPEGEHARHHAPYVNGESIYSMLYNRNKHAMTLNTRHPAALEILTDLVREVDVLVENYRPGTLDAMGLPSHRLSELNPNLILTSISGFGQTGPLAHRPLFDAIAQAYSGFMSLTGEPDGPPTRTGTYIADYVAGIYAALGTMTALLHRERGGGGQIVDVASVDALFACLGTAPSAAAMLEEDPTRVGSTRDPLVAPADVYPTLDGELYLHAATDPMFRVLCGLMNDASLATDPRFLSTDERVAHLEELTELVSVWTRGQTRAQLSELLEEAGIPHAPVNSVAEAVASEQIAAREMMIDVEHRTAGRVKLPGFPVKYSATPSEMRKPPPTLGEDTDDILGRFLGYPEARIKELRVAGAL